MISRRGIVIGGLCLAGAVAGQVLKPNHKVSLLGKAKLADIVPSNFAGWSGRSADDLVAPATENSLSDKLYGEVLERIYTHGPTGREIMLLFAHGDSQTNDLQLHRPEVCYPAFGFHLRENREAPLALAPQATLHGRHIVAEANQRRENIFYWTRFGELLPVRGGEQRMDRMKIAIQGIVPDGLLARFSMVDPNSAVAFPALDEFAKALLLATHSANRPALIGTTLSQALAV
jgi:EpsI family protein